MAVERLTVKKIEALEKEAEPRLIHDSKTPGLILSVNKRRNSWRIKADLWRNRQLVKTVKHTLGTTDELTLDEARDKAQKVLRDIKRGIDPNEPHQAQSKSVGDMTLAELWAAYDEFSVEQGRSPHTLRHLRSHLGYLSAWHKKPLAQLRKSWARAEHERITEEHGPYTANSVMRSLQAAWNWAVKLDDEEVLPPNPVGGVHFNKEKPRGGVILPEELPRWWRRTGELPNSLRTAMHRLNLLSGLRPGTCASIEREWIDFEERVIQIPKMKTGGGFTLPLSGPMISIIKEAIRLGDLMYPNSPFLFPTKNRKGEVVPTQQWREKTMPGQIGHILRHTYRSIVDKLEIPQSRARALVHHHQPGIEAHYLHSSVLRTELLIDQERISAYILDLVG